MLAPPVQNAESYTPSHVKSPTTITATWSTCTSTALAKDRNPWGAPSQGPVSRAGSAAQPPSQAVSAASARRVQVRETASTSRRYPGSGVPREAPERFSREWAHPRDNDADSE